MREISEKEAYELAEGGTEFPVILKVEDEVTESAVTLKKFPTGYVLGVSCDTKNLFRIFFSEDFDSINNLCSSYLAILKKKGNPFADE